MSMSEILEEVSKLSTEERHLLFEKLYELEGGILEETPEMLAAIDEANASPESDDVSAEEMRRNVVEWARTK